MPYRFTLVCPRCNKTTVTDTISSANPRLNCGNCLWESVEIVELKIVKMEEV